jgi:uncharacterized protein (DUF2147 family)
MQGRPQGQADPGAGDHPRLKKAEGKDVWEGGKILDPENGREYGARLTPIEGGKKLEVRGSIGPRAAPFWRTQTWPACSKPDMNNEQ